jgi:hypothetical protein
MKWSEMNISFRLEDHPKTKLFDRNLPFVVKLPTGMHKVAKASVDNRASFSFIMTKMFIEMCLSQSDLNSIDDTFHSVISG